MRTWGASPLIVDSAKAALDRLKESLCENIPVDLAILDIHMPDMDGMMLAQALKADPRLCQIPLLALSSVEPQGTVGGPDDSIFFAWVRKPVRQSLLRECLFHQRHAVPDVIRDQTDMSPTIPRFHGRILLAEDNLVNREVAAAMLELLGYHVDLAENGRQAVEAIAQQPYDLVLMDCQMPELDGFTATSTIRLREVAAGSGGHVPIIALTANAMEGDRERCLSAGMDDYLSKPFTQEGLASILQQWLERKSVAPLSDRSPLSLLPAPSVEKIAPMTPLGIPLIDESVLEAMLALERAGRPSMLQKALSRYLLESKQLLERIRDAIHIGDTEALHAGAQQLKSASTQVGAMASSFHASEIERLAYLQRLDGAADLLGPLEESLERVSKIFDDRLRRRVA